MIKIELLYNPFAPFIKQQMIILQNIARARPGITLSFIVVRTAEDLRKHPSFAGSPTILINGRDIQPETRARVFSPLQQRTYFWKTISMPYAPVKLVLAKLTQFFKQQPLKKEASQKKKRDSL